MKTLSFTELMNYVDLTYLKDEVLVADLQELAKTAEQYQTATVCVWPKALGLLPIKLNIPKATVVNFPHGNEKTSAIQKQIDSILLAFPQTEIDYVFPYLNYWSGQKQIALKECQTISQHCHAHGVKIKVILETGYQPDLKLISQLAQAVLNCEVDMLKTSTGKIAQGASIPAVDAICHAIAKSGLATGIKVSGGIRSYHQALQYFELITKCIDRVPNPSWLRFGASQLHHD